MATALYATPPRARRSRPRCRRRRSERPADDELTVSQSRLFFLVGPNNDNDGLASSSAVVVTVQWAIQPPINLLDWIGLYDTAEPNPLNYLDYKSFGACGRQSQGSVVWTLKHRLFNSESAQFAGGESTVCFKYFDGATGRIRAATGPIKVFVESAGGPVQSASSFSLQTRREVNLLDERSTDAKFNSVPSAELAGPRSASSSSSAVDGATHSVRSSISSTGCSVAPFNKFVQPLWQCDVDGVPERPYEDTVRQLPQKWEARVDVEGRVFYVDHERRITCWLAPTDNGEPSAETLRRHRPAPISQRSAVLHRRTVTTTASSAKNRNAADHEDIQNNNSTTKGGWPAVDFITRSEFFTLLQENEVAKSIYQNSAAVQHMLHKIRKEPASFEKFRHSGDLTSLLAAFVDVTQPLPEGWQLKFDKDHRRAFFVDHNLRRTTSIDPRLPAAFVSSPTLSAVQRRRHRSCAFSQRQRSSNEHQQPEDSGANSWEAVAVDCLIELTRRDSPLAVLMEERVPNFVRDSKVRKKLQEIRKNGLAAFRKHRHDADLIAILNDNFSLLESQLDDELELRSAQVVDSLFCRKVPTVDEKVADFFEFLQRMGFGRGPGLFKLQLRRGHLLTDAFEQLLAVNNRVLQRSKLTVQFDGEDALDYGGPSREFFCLVSRELFNPYYGLFEYSSADAYTVQISPNSVMVANFPQWFHFAGRLLALALIHRHLIDAFLTRPFYKFLLRRSMDLSDVEGLDGQFYSSLRWLEQNPVTEQLQLTFSVNELLGGQLSEVALIVNGAEVVVTDENKTDYIKRMVAWRLNRGVEKQWSCLHKGFYEVLGDVGGSSIRRFDAVELELVLSGSVEIDLDDWRASTAYKGGYASDSVVVHWFWQAVHRFSNAQRLQLLQFVTGTSTIPYDGLAALRGSDGQRRRFTIERWGDESCLPRAHSCFNRLDLPPYSSLALLERKLLLALNETDCYAID